MPLNVTRRKLALPERGVEIALLDWGGDGPLALLHHGNGFLAASFHLVARELCKHFHVVGMDGRGHGDSSVPETEEAYAWTEYGKDLLAVARVLAAEGDGRVALGLGNSFGGTSMLLAAAEEPSLFERLLLVDPVLPPPPSVSDLDPERDERRNSLRERALRRRNVFPDRATAAEIWADKELFANWHPEALPIYVAEGLRDRPDGQVELKCSGTVEARIFANTFRCDVWAVAEKVDVPALLLWATRGDFPRAMYEGFVKRLPDGRIQDVESGHLIQMERPDVVVRAALEWTGADTP